MSKFFDTCMNNIADWFVALFQWTIHQPWVMGIFGTGLLVVIIIGLLGDDGSGS